MAKTAVSSFKKHYRSLFELFGYPLTERSATSPKLLADAEKRLGTKIPAALRDYYLVAGRERRFNHCHNQLLAPQQLSINKQRLLFMAENQTVLWWGVSIRNPQSDDPPISQGINAEPIAWFPEHRKCSVFLTVMLHYQAVSGGFRFCGWANVPEQLDYRFEENGWMFQGEVNSLLAYSRTNRAVCLMPSGDLPSMQQWSVLAGAKTKAHLQTITDDLGVTFT